MGMNGLVANVLQEIGVSPERFSLKWASAAEAPRFVKLITEFTGRIKELGPLGRAEGIEPAEMKTRLDRALAAVSSRKVRMVYGNTAKAIRKEGIFTQEYISGVIKEKLSKAISGALSAEEEPAEEALPAAEKEKTAAVPKPAPKETTAKPESKPTKEKPKKAAATKSEPAPKKKAAPPPKATAKSKPASKKAAAKKK